MTFRGWTDCPQDGNWKIPTDSDICTEIETLQLLFGFVRMLRPEVVIETGCNVGCASLVITEALKANGKGVLFTCDTDNSCAGTTKLRTGAQVWTMTGLELIKNYPHADLYWIDSSEEGRIAELEWLAAYGKPGATVLVHDTSLMGELAADVSAFPQAVLLPGPRGLGVIRL